MYRKKQLRHYIRPLKERIIPVVLIVGGLFLVLAFTPLWMWVFVLGAGFVYCGIYILKKWR